MFKDSSVKRRIHVFGKVHLDPCRENALKTKSNLVLLSGWSIVVYPKLLVDECEFWLILRDLRSVDATDLSN